MSESAKRGRPAVVTLLCVLGFEGAAASLLEISTSFDRALGTAFQDYHAAAFLINVAAYSAVWKMKRWGVVLYCAAVLVHLGVLSQVAHFTPVRFLVAVLINAAFIAGLIYNLPEMD